MKMLDLVLFAFVAMTLGFGVAAWAKVVAFNDHHLVSVMRCVNHTQDMSREEAFITCEKALR